MPRWTLAQVGDQRGRTVVITGGNTGIGRETARVLAARGATVVLACRDPDKSAVAVADLAAAAPAAQIETVPLDLASLASIRAAAEQLREAHPRIDLLINNAGVMMTPYRTTQDGFELQFGTNHLGHFALTGLLLAQLLPVAGSRVVTVSSAAHAAGTLDFDNLQSERGYRRLSAYAQSKLANLLFTNELQRRMTAAGVGTIATAAHPGVTRTELNRHLPAAMLAGGRSWGVLRLFSHDARAGALPVLRAATDPTATGGDYYAPAGMIRANRHTGLAKPSKRAQDVELQRRLWIESERLTGVTFPAELSIP